MILTPDPSLLIQQPDKEAQQTLRITLEEGKHRVLAAQQATDSSRRRERGARLRIDDVGIAQLGDIRWIRRLGTRERLIVVRRLLRSSHTVVSSEGEATFAEIKVGTERLQMVGEQEDELADLVVGRDGKLEVEDGAHVVGRDAGNLGTLERNVGQLRRYEQHKEGLIETNVAAIESTGDCRDKGCEAKNEGFRLEYK